MHLTSAIADLVISEGLYLNMDPKPRPKKVLELARSYSKDKSTPDRKLIYKYLLGLIHGQIMQRNLTMVYNKADFWIFIYRVWCHK